MACLNVNKIDLFCFDLIEIFELEHVKVIK